MPSISTNCRPHQRPAQSQCDWSGALGRATRGTCAARTAFGFAGATGGGATEPAATGAATGPRASFAAATCLAAASSATTATSSANAGTRPDAAIKAVAAVNAKIAARILDMANQPSQRSYRIGQV